MSKISASLVLALLCVSCLGQYTETETAVPEADPTNLVWKPYLQQLSDTGVIILWATHIGTKPTVRYGTQNDDLSTDAGGRGPKQSASWKLPQR